MQNIGERLEEARKRKGISIREAAEATKVRGDYLHKYESNQFDINLPEIYVRGFLRTYANYLGLPGDKIVADYNALGHSAPKTKGLSRELYGRMDLSVATAKESARESDGDHADPKNAEGNPATFKPSPGPLPYVDRALLIKAGALVGVLVVLIALIWIGIRITRTDPEEPINAQTVSTTKPSNTALTATIYALDNVRVKVVEVSTDKELFQGAIARGDSRTIPWTSDLYVTADFQQNIEIELKGTRYPTNETGHKKVRIPAPSTMP
jgi:cytoskeleton protein RodZ